jgi:KipI family sensor histidine kinase inhibitor
MTLPPPRLLPCGDAALSVDFGNVISPAINARVHALDAALRARGLAGIRETVPTYRALSVFFDPLLVEFDTLCAEVLQLVEATTDATPASPRRWRVPVAFGGSLGEDLAECAELAGLSETAFLASFTSPLYRVMMIGFMPGFAYLAGLPEALARPRRPTPRPVVPAGTVSIGGAQAAVGSLKCPSGWHLIGRTPARSFLRSRDPVFLFEAGDEIRFEPIDIGDYHRLSARATENDPVIKAEVLP